MTNYIPTYIKDPGEVIGGSHDWKQIIGAETVIKHWDG